MEYILLIILQYRWRRPMSFEISRAEALLTDSVAFRAMRQDMIASNIANIDTPFYKARDIEFESVLAEKKRDIFKVYNPKPLKMAITANGQIPYGVDDTPGKAIKFYRDGHGMGNDGNTVDMDIETSEMSKNNTMYNAVIAAYKKDVRIFRAMLEGSQRTS